MHTGTGDLAVLSIHAGGQAALFSGYPRLRRFHHLCCPSLGLGVLPLGQGVIHTPILILTLIRVLPNGQAIVNKILESDPLWAIALRACRLTQSLATQCGGKQSAKNGLVTPSILGEMRPLTWSSIMDAAAVMCVSLLSIIANCSELQRPRSGSCVVASLSLH